MMGTMATEPIPPFERFYLAHRDEVLGYLRRLLGAARRGRVAGDVPARAARVRPAAARPAPARVGVHDRDERRDGRAAREAATGRRTAEPVVELRRDAFRELEHLTGDLPPTERAAVVLRYGYDLPYAQIADALGSSEEAARAAASSGVRRLRRTHERHT